MLSEACLFYLGQLHIIKLTKACELLAYCNQMWYTITERKCYYGKNI